jgi:hypothetical protein
LICGRHDLIVVGSVKVRAEEHIRELLRLPAKQRAQAAKVLLDSLDEATSPLASGTGTVSYEDLPHAGRGELDSDDELAELDEVAADKEGLRAAVRAAVEAELEPLHELTSLLRRFAEHARTTGHALRARTT